RASRSRNRIEWKPGKTLGKLRLYAFKPGMPLGSKPRKDRPSPVLYKSLTYSFDRLGFCNCNLNIPAAMGDPRGGSKDNRNLEFVRKLKSKLCQIIRFQRGCRVKDRNICKVPENPRILFGLGGMRPGIVGNEQDKGSFYPDIAQAHEGVGCDIQSYLLHCHKRLCSRISSPYSRFKCNLFIAGPLNIDSIP